MTKVKCDCFDREEEPLISGRKEVITCPLCINGDCTAEKLEVSFDGEYWHVSCPKEVNGH